MLETLAQVGSALTGFSLLLAVVALLREMRSQNLQSLFYLHEYLANDEFSDARRRVRTALHALPYESWTDADRGAASKVAASYDQAGLLIGAGVLNGRTRFLFLGSSWGESICDQFEALTPFLDDQQTPTKTGREFFHHFASLYNQASETHRLDRGADGVQHSRANRVWRAIRS